MRPTEPSPATDAELVRRSAGGDEDAFRELFERKRRRVYLIARQIVGEAGAAEDVVQETFLSLWRNCHRYRVRWSVDAWLTRIATNRAIDRYRTERRMPQAVGEGGASDAGTRAIDALAEPGQTADPSLPARLRELQELWDRAAAGLPPQQRAAFVLREIEGLPAREVAAALGCSTSTVRSHVALARKALRERLGERLGARLGAAARHC